MFGPITLRLTGGKNVVNARCLVGVATLYLRFVPGGLLSVGAGHAAQGYGEVCRSAIETSLKGEVQVIVHKNQ
jgi:acetamidase/formamidase